MSHSTKLDAARRWLKLGFDLLPIQPNSKRIMQGFGQYQQRIKTVEQAARWWDKSAAIDLHSPNIAVIANDKNFILDFDDFAVYAEWAKAANEVFTSSYTEYTPRGGAHVFLCGDVVSGLQLRPAVEIKRVVLVSPSEIDGIQYDEGHGDIFAGDVDDAFFSLSVVGTPTAHLLRTEQGKKIYRIQSIGDVIGQIKAHVSILDMLEKFSPETYKTLRGSGRWRAMRCPFHKGGKEKFASGWIDTERNTFGCHTCHEHGDVINLYAQLTKQDNDKAIKTLAADLGASGGAR